MDFLVRHRLFRRLDGAILTNHAGLGRSIQPLIRGLNGELRNSVQTRMRLTCIEFARSYQAALAANAMTKDPSAVFDPNVCVASRSRQLCSRKY